MSYQCGNCDTTRQWSCNCWQSEAARWKPDQMKRERAVRPDRGEQGSRWSRR